MYIALSVFSYFPHYISYFNEFVWDRRRAYEILADSNIDWGGNDWFLEQYLKKYPDSLVEPNHPTAGRIIVGINHLVGLLNGEDFRWLRENFKPNDQIAYSYLVYIVSKDDLIKKNL